MDDLILSGRLRAVKRVVSLVFGPLLSNLDERIYQGDLVPKHGGGATADRKVGNEKWEQDEWTERLETLFPYVEYVLPNARFWEHGQPGSFPSPYDSVQTTPVRYLSPWDERPAKMVSVPKTHSTPRLIAEEPTCMQYVQQAIARPLMSLIERDRVASWFTGFEQQWPNQAMAQIGSEDGSLATLDLSEASDRVGNWIVEVLFEDFPWFVEAIQATRSRTIQLPSGEVFPLRKFASMGSAMTFPIEAMVFTAITLEAVLRTDARPFTQRSIKSLRDVVRVYGDDIIVPTHCAETVIESLELFGLKVNRHKSFWSGEFRESCGKEYWKGHDVSITRFRKAAPASLRDVENIVSWVETRNLFSEDLRWPHTVQLLDGFLEGLLGHFPWVQPSSVLLGRTRPDRLYQVDRVSEVRYQNPLTKGWVTRPKLRKQQLDGPPALLKCLLTTVGMQDVDEEHLRRGGRPLSVNMHLGMAQPF